MLTKVSRTIHEKGENFNKDRKYRKDKKKKENQRGKEFKLN